MGKKKVLNVDLANVMDIAKGGGRITTLGWGDVVDFEKVEGDKLVVNAFDNKPTADGIESKPRQGTIKIPKGMTAEEVLVDPADNKVMRLNLIDVQQGDAAIYAYTLDAKGVMQPSPIRKA